MIRTIQTFPEENVFSWENIFPWIMREVNHWLCICANISHKGVGSCRSWIKLIRCQRFCNRVYTLVSEVFIIIHNSGFLFFFLFFFFRRDHYKTVTCFLVQSRPCLRVPKCAHRMLLRIWYMQIWIKSKLQFSKCMVLLPETPKLWKITCWFWLVVAYNMWNEGSVNNEIITSLSYKQVGYYF